MRTCFCTGGRDLSASVWENKHIDTLETAYSYHLLESF